MANGDYGYFGKGDTGYAQYMTAFNRNFGGSSGGGNHNNGGGGDGSGCGCLIAIAVVVVLVVGAVGLAVPTAAAGTARPMVRTRASAKTNAFFMNIFLLSHRFV